MVKKLISLQYLMVICVMLVVSSCDRDNGIGYPNAVDSHPYYPLNEFVVVSGDENTVTFALNTEVEYDLPAPAKWTGITVRYTYIDSPDTDYQLVFCNKDVSRDWGGSTSSYTDSNGNPVLSVTLPPNTSGKIIAYQISTCHWFDNRNVGGMSVMIYQLPYDGD